MRVAFVVSDLSLSGGVHVLLRHASALNREDSVEVIVVSVRGSDSSLLREEFSDVPAIALDDFDSSRLPVDVAIATYWETLFFVERVQPKRFVWFMQSVEDRFYLSHDPFATIASAVSMLKIPVVTEANWIRDLLLALDPTRVVEIARNGIDKTTFSPAIVAEPEDDPRIRVLVEGPSQSHIKDVEAAIEGVLRSRAPLSLRHITSGRSISDDPRYELVSGPLTFDEMAREYRWCDVLVKTSRVEGMYGPPLEAFHCGATVVTTPVTGFDEFIVDRSNALVVGWDDPVQIGQAIDRLHYDREFLERLKSGALETASRWPSWVESSSEFFGAFLRCLERGDESSDSANLSALRAIRSIRSPQRSMHLQLIHTDRAAQERLDMLRSAGVV